MFTDPTIMFWRTLNMYLSNKYTKWYESIITNAQQRVNQRGYFEKHHIVPKSLGGSNDISNLVKLTPKEHFVCHLLLVRMTEGAYKTKMRYAAWMLSKNNPYQNRVKITGRRFQILREQLILANKERPGLNLGKVMSDTTKQKLSNTLKGRKQPLRTAEHNAKLGKYVRTDEHREAISKMRKSQIGKHTHSNETLKKMSAWQVGIPKPKVSCEYCGKEASLMNYRKWHGDACKFKS